MTIHVNNLCIFIKTNGSQQKLAFHNQEDPRMGSIKLAKNIQKAWPCEHFYIVILENLLIDTAIVYNINKNIKQIF